MGEKRAESLSSCLSVSLSSPVCVCVCLCVCVCVHCVFAVWRAVRSDNLFHWLLSCFSHYHPLSLHLSSPPFSPFVICARLPPSVCPSDSVFEKLSHILLHNNISHVHFCSVSFMHTYLLPCFVSFCVLRTNTHTYKLSFLPLCRKQYTGMGVRGVEGGKTAFQRCQGHPVTHTHTHTHKEDVGWTMDRSQEC